MQKWVKMSLVVAMGATMTVAGIPATANAASKTKVLSTRKIAATTVHGRQGNIYSGVKLTKVRYNLKHYRYTTWTASKKAVVKKNGKKAYVTYIKSGAKHGWVYSRYLTNGKAPFNKVKKMKNDMLATKRAALSSGSANVQSTVRDQSTYEDLGYALTHSGGFGWWGDDMEDRLQDQAGLLNIYDVYKGRFSKSENENLAAMAQKVESLQPSEDNNSFESSLDNFAEALGDLIADL